MEEHLKRQIGEELEPGGRPKAPGRLELLQRFINTYNHDFPPDWDRIGTPEKARAWLRSKGLAESGDVERLTTLREALRGLLTGEGSAEAVRAAAAGRPSLTVVLDLEGTTALEGADAVATLMGILHEAQLTGDWTRMKGCRQCGYAFYDRSKNRSAAWCSMSICGNRTKNRTYYRRHR